MESRKIQDLKNALDALINEARDTKTWLSSSIKATDWKAIDPAVQEYALHEVTAARNMIRIAKAHLEKPRD